MALYIDSAYLDDITKAVETMNIAGVTTNPTILRAARERGQTLPLLVLIEKLLQVCQGDVFVQPGATDPQEMSQLAMQFILTGGIRMGKQRVVAKLPMTETGVRVAKRLKDEQRLRRFAFTAVNTTAQAYIAGVMGAEFIIPYYNRMERTSENAGQRIAEMAKILRYHQFETRILAASIKTPQEAANALLAGAQDITAPPEVLLEMISDAQTEDAVEQFARDWQKMNGL
jgi:TalC/MipB family fructose-6-phosphate aldolase